MTTSPLEQLLSDLNKLEKRFESRVIEFKRLYNRQDTYKAWKRAWLDVKAVRRKANDIAKGEG